jgi:hypothetical protein
MVANLSHAVEASDHTGNLIDRDSVDPLAPTGQHEWVAPLGRHRRSSMNQTVDGIIRNSPAPALGC